MNPNKIINKYTPHNDPFDLVIDLDKSYGSRIVDKRSGEEYLDCLSYIASLPLGHNHLSLFDREFTKKLLRVARTKPNNAEFYSEELADFYKTFAKIAKPKEFKYLFFIEGGAAAVENSIKTAIDWKVRLILEQQGQEVKPEKYIDIPHGNDYSIIYLEGAYHGRGGYSTSITNTHKPWTTSLFPKFRWNRLRSHMHDPSTSQLDWYKTRLSSINLPKETIAALIVEPVQSVGGDVHFDKEVHKLFRDFATENDIMLIYDEIQSGIGLTGKMWGYQHYGVTPDIVVFGKKTQVCGFMATEKLDQVSNHAMVLPARLSSTFSGGLTDMVRCQKYLEVIKEDKLVTNAKVVGKELLNSLKHLEQTYPKLISNSRGLGLMCAFDLPNTEVRNQFVEDCFNFSNIILLGCGERSVRLRPALIFSQEDVAELYYWLNNVVETGRYSEYV